MPTHAAASTPARSAPLVQALDAAAAADVLVDTAPGILSASLTEHATDAELATNRRALGCALLERVRVPLAALFEARRAEALARKVTGMLLWRDTEDLLGMLTRPDDLLAHCRDAMQVRRRAARGVFQCPQVCAVRACVSTGVFAALACRTGMACMLNCCSAAALAVRGAQRASAAALPLSRDASLVTHNWCRVIARLSASAGAAEKRRGPAGGGGGGGGGRRLRAPARWRARGHAERGAPGAARRAARAVR